MKRRFPVHFSKRVELSTSPDGTLCLNERIVTPSLRKSVPEDPHIGHSGVEKMMSSARPTCWWPEVIVDKCHTANNCGNHHKLKSQSSE